MCVCVCLHKCLEIDEGKIFNRKPSFNQYNRKMLDANNDNEKYDRNIGGMMCGTCGIVYKKKLITTHVHIHQHRVGMHACELCVDYKGCTVGYNMPVNDYGVLHRVRIH